MFGELMKADRGISYPDDFQPNDNNMLNAQRWGLNLADMVEAFADYHQSKGSRFVNWNLALNTWMRNQHERNESKFGRRPQDPPVEFRPTPTKPPSEFQRARDNYLARQAQGRLY